MCLLDTRPFHSFKSSLGIGQGSGTGTPWGKADFQGHVDA